MVSPAGVAQLVELQPSKLDVAGSSPVARSEIGTREMNALVAQAAEHVLGKDEVTGSNPVQGSTIGDLSVESADEDGDEGASADGDDDEDGER